MSDLDPRPRRCRGGGDGVDRVIVEGHPPQYSPA
jgi:hypothetical protein